VAVNKVVLASGAVDGVNVAVLDAAEYVTVPAADVPSVVLVRVKLPGIVAGAMSLLKTALIFVLVGTFTAPGAGKVRMTVGCVVSANGPVMKLHTKLTASGKPLVSCAAVVMVATQSVLEGSVMLGVKVADCEGAS
jgi:hypothetical protein